MNQRLQKLKELIKQESLDAALISSVPNIIYLTNFNHFSPAEREAFLLITQKANYIITDKRYTHAVQTHVKDFKLLEIFYGHGFKEWVKQIAEEEHIQRLGIEENNLTYGEYAKIAPFIKSFKQFDLSALRLTKSAEEMKMLQKACEITDKTFTYILSQINPGLKEQELALEMEIYMKKQSAGLSFDSIVAFGENAAYVHHKTGERTLKRNDGILLDFGAKYGNYCADMSRSIVFGKAGAALKKAHGTVLAAQEKAAEFIEKLLEQGKEIKGAEVDKVARDYIIAQGYPSYPHGLGHGVGLEVHELPALRPPSASLLQSGMVFSIEPGIYVPGQYGIRIEDIYAIQNNKLVQLTKSSKNLIEI